MQEDEEGRTGQLGDVGGLRAGTTLPRGAWLLTGLPWDNYFVLTVCQELPLFHGPPAIIFLPCRPGIISELASPLGRKQGLKNLPRRTRTVETNGDKK